MCYQFTEILKGLLTPLIACVTTYIAWQQWQTNKQKFVLDRYDRRLKVYEEVKKILGIIARDAKASDEDLLKFYIAVYEADFLFGSEIVEYIDEIYKRGKKLQYWSREYRDYTQEKPEGYNHQEVVDEKSKELDWFSKQFDLAKQKFKRYLDISGQ